MDVAAGFPLGFDDVVTLFGEVLDEHFLEGVRWVAVEVVVWRE